MFSLQAILSIDIMVNSICEAVYEKTLFGATPTAAELDLALEAC